MDKEHQVEHLLYMIYIYIYIMPMVARCCQVQKPQLLQIIATRLEAIAPRVEAITIRNK